MSTINILNNKTVWVLMSSMKRTCFKFVEIIFELDTIYYHLNLTICILRSVQMAYFYYTRV